MGVAAMKALFHFVAERVGGGFDTRAGNRHEIDSDSSSNSSRADISALSSSALQADYLTIFLIFHLQPY